MDAKGKSVSIKGANGEEAVFYVEDKGTTVVSGSKKVALPALREGDWISITGDTRNGRKVATYIEVVEDPTGSVGRTTSTSPAPTRSRSSSTRRPGP